MSRRRRTPSPPREMTAKFDSTCAETGKAIKKGDTIVYYPASRKAYHQDSETAADFRSQQFSEGWGMMDANW